MLHYLRVKAFKSMLFSLICILVCRRHELIITLVINGNMTMVLIYIQVMFIAHLIKLDHIILCFLRKHKINHSRV